MVKLETNFKVLKELIGKNISLKELEDTLFDLGMELEESDGDEIKIDITSERADMVSTQGLARVLRAYFGVKNPVYKSAKSSYEVVVDKSVKSVRPHTCCAVIKNLSLSDENIKEIIWTQEKIHDTFGRNRKKVAIGLYPMESIKFPITFRADKPEKIKFRPLDFDKELNGKDIVLKTQSGKSYGFLLEGLKEYPYFIDANNNILSMPPLINSYDSGRVTKDTKDIFIECSGHDFDALSKTLNILVYMFKDMGGDIFETTLVFGDKKVISPNLLAEKRSISTSYINEVTGLSLSAKECGVLLEKMMHNVLEVKKDEIVFEVLPIRTDVWHDVDIVDDVVRAFGVNNIEPELPRVASYANVLVENKIKNQVVSIMSGLGFNEVFTLLLTDKKDQYERMDLDVKNQDFMKLGHSAESSINMVRTWLLPETLKAVYYNRNKSLPLKIFEVNEVVLPDSSKDVLSKTKNKMSCLICDDAVSFTDIKGVLDNLLLVFGKEFDLSVKDFEFFIKGRSASIVFNGKEVGFIGEVSPSVLSNWDIKYPISCFELDLDELFSIN
ncbi:MAG: phenylalanine--tRNA ligase subunit beta [Candidatus Woesearchaeota archaeon]